MSEIIKRGAREVAAGLSLRNSTACINFIYLTWHTYDLHAKQSRRPHLSHQERKQNKLKFMSEEKRIVRLAKDGTLAVPQQSKRLLRLSDDGKLVVKTLGGAFQEVSPLPPTFQEAFVYLIIDNSSSMVGDKLDQAKKGAIDFAESALRQGYEVGIICFSDYAKHISAPTSELASIRISVGGIKASGGTNLTPALDTAFGRLGEGTTTLRSVLVITDGATTNMPGALAIATRMKSSGISILTIGTDDADYSFLAALASTNELATKVVRAVLGETISSAAKMLPGIEKRQLGSGK